MAKATRAPLVAVVEDDPGVREATAGLLESAGFAVRGFTSAEQFLRSRARARTRCLILDVSLPGISGLELQEQLRAQGIRLPVIVVTATDDPDGRVRARALEGGALSFLRKPVRARDLLSAVKRALAKPHAR
jgi:FixJ family two-component response regulator